MSESFEQLDPNYVIAFEYSVDNLTQLITELSAKGLHVLPRPGYDKSTVYAFTRVEERDFQNNVERNGKTVLETNEESGDAILRKICEPLKFVKSITPIHDSETRKRLDKTATSLINKPFLLPSDHDLVLLERLTRNPRQALYFAYFRRYIIWLLPLSFVGAFTGLIRPSTPWEFNIPYTLTLIVWALLFASSWVYKAHAAYGAKFGKVQSITETSERKLSPPSIVLWKKLCFVPVAAVFVASLVAFQFFCFFVEIYVTQFYAGPLKSIFSLIPTVLICSYIPILTMIYNKFFVDKLVDWEDGPDPARSKVEKNFVLTFFTSYMPLFITLFFYLPLGYKITPELRAIIAEWSFMLHIPVNGFKANVTDEDFIIDVKRYRNQFFYFIVTAQVIAVVMQNLLPIATDKILPLLKKKENQNGEDLNKVLTTTVKSYFPREVPLWQKVNSYHINGYGEFDVDENFKKLVIQFGFLTIFSIIWPLAPLVCLIFNFFIFKADLWRALKKCKPSSNPEDIQVNENNVNAVAVSADPWNRILELIAWVGTTACPTLLIMYRYSGLPGVGLQTKLEKRDLWYRQSPMPYSWTTILIIAILSEHAAVLSYAYLRKLFVASGQKLTHGFVPATDLQEPPQIDLTVLVKETTSFMSKIRGDGNNSGTVDKGRQNEKSTISKNTATSFNQKLEEPLAKKVPTNREIKTAEQPRSHEDSSVNASSTRDVGTHSDAVSKPQAVANVAPKTAVPEQPNGGYKNEPEQRADQNVNGKEVSPETTSTQDTAQNSLDQGKGRNSPNGFSGAAGATLPETIPTSKNYYLRYDKDGNPVRSLSSAETSKSSLSKERALPGEAKNEPIKQPKQELQQEPLKENNIPVPKENTHVSEVTPEKHRDAKPAEYQQAFASEPRSLDPAKTITSLPQVRPVHDENARYSPSKPDPDSSLAAAAAAAAAKADQSSHSRTSSQVNAVQQFGRDNPTLVKSTNTTETSGASHGRSSFERANSVKSKAAPSTDSRSSAGARKSTLGTKRASIDSLPKDSASKHTEHKHKHKKGLLHKLKKKL